MDLVKNKDIVIVAIGELCQAEKIAECLREDCNDLALLTLAPTYSKGILPMGRFYSKNKLKKEFRLVSFVMRSTVIDPAFLLYIIYGLHFFSVCYAFCKLKKRFDIYLGMGYVFTFFGLIFKRLGICRKVIYYSGDYFREVEKWDWSKNWYRFFQTKCFQFIDRLNVRFSDAVWNGSYAMIAVRGEKGIIMPKDTPNLVLSLGITVNEELLQNKRYDSDEIVFIGNLQKNQGLTLFLDILPELISEIPDIRLHIVGTGSYEVNLRNRVSAKQLDKYVKFYGFIKSYKTIEEIFSRSVLGLAHYIPHGESFTQYITPGKIATYLSFGLPIIMTDVAEFAGKLNEAKAGIIIKYSNTELKEAVLGLLKNRDLLNLYGQNAKNLALRYSWHKILDEALGETFSSWQFKNRPEVLSGRS